MLDDAGNGHRSVGVGVGGVAAFSLSCEVHVVAMRGLRHVMWADQVVALDVRLVHGSGVVNAGVA